MSSPSFEFVDAAAEVAALGIAAVIVVVDAAAEADYNNGAVDRGRNVLTDLSGKIDIGVAVVAVVAFDSNIVDEHSYHYMHWGCCTCKVVDRGSHMLQGLVLDLVPAVVDIDFDYVHMSVAVAEVVAGVDYIVAGAVDTVDDDIGMEDLVLVVVEDLFE